MPPMVTVYANQAVVRSEDLPGVIQAAEVLGFGVKIENVLVPDEEDGYALAWIVTREEEPPAYENWDGRYEEVGEEMEMPDLSSVD